MPPKAEPGSPICLAFNISVERVAELINKYARANFNKFLRGELTNGELIASFVDIDEITVNEKCFLVYHCTFACEKVLAEQSRQAKLRQLVAEGVLF